MRRTYGLTRCSLLGKEFGGLRANPGGGASELPFGAADVGPAAELANAAKAYGRMIRNGARFRIVLVTGQ
jgi:hypothetical protein